MSIRIQIVYALHREKLTVLAPISLSTASRYSSSFDLHLCGRLIGVQKTLSSVSFLRPDLSLYAFSQVSPVVVELYHSTLL